MTWSNKGREERGMKRDGKRRGRIEGVVRICGWGLVAPGQTQQDGEN